MSTGINHPFFDGIAFAEKHDAWNAYTWDKKTFPRRRFLNLLKKAHPFVFDSRCTTESFDTSGIRGEDWIEAMKKLEDKKLEEKVYEKAGMVEEFSLPYSTSLYLLSVSGGPTVLQKGRDHVYKFKHAGYLVNELSPEKFEIFSVNYFENEKGEDGYPAFDFFTIDLTNPDVSAFANDIIALNSLSNMISVKRLGIEVRLNRTLKTRGLGSGYTTYKYENVIHIAHKEEYEYTKSLSKEINWEYVGFWRGHWRALYFSDDVIDQFGRRVVDYNRIGKNRKGEYVTPGYTWIVEHTRGNKELAKIRTHAVKHA